LKEGEDMIQLDKSFVEERRRNRKELMDRYQMAAKKDYDDYLKKKDVTILYITLSYLGSLIQEIRL
jgi:hypothetical protein